MNETNLTENDTNLAENEPIAAAAEPEPAEETVRAIEAAVPELLRQSRERATRQEHPAGEVFFRGNAEEVSDSEAEEVARKQLERSGLLRGQKVGVAD